MAYFKDITFTDNFLVGGMDQGSAVTVGAGIGLKSIYATAKTQNKMFMGSSAVTVSLAGGYIQGAGHSAFSPIYGLAADNILCTCFHSFSIKTSLKNNRVQCCSGKWLLCCCQFSLSPQLYVLVSGAWWGTLFPPFMIVFWALHGGGAGSWGVIVDATICTFPMFNATMHTVNILMATLEQTGDLITLHASHIKDWDNVRAGQYFNLTGLAMGSTLVVLTFFKDLNSNSS